MQEDGDRSRLRGAHVPSMHLSNWVMEALGQERRAGRRRHHPIDQTPLQQFTDVEEEFLHASEFGDVEMVKRLLAMYPQLDVDCTDALGRTAIRLAVKNEHLEIVELLLERSSQHHIHEAVLQAISAGHIQIAETILKHRRYLDMCKERRKLGDTDGFYKTAYAESQFSPDITPLILAAQKNQYELVQLLLLRGETIMKPHKFTCGCQECRNKMKFDQLRLAKYRLNAYRGLASEAYISLSSKDPILTAFRLGAELKRLSRDEKHFLKEYRDLAEQLSDYTVKCLDRVRTQKELEIVLNKTGRPSVERYDNLARFKLALKLEEKKFVAHANCQQSVERTWNRGSGKLKSARWCHRLPRVLLFIVSYPVLAILHVLAPGFKVSKVLRSPVVKFLCHATSFLTFLALIVLLTVESSASVSSQRTLATQHSQVCHAVYVPLYQLAVNRTGDSNALAGPDFPLRASYPTITEIMMTLWIVGMVFEQCGHIFRTGLKDHLRNVFNFRDMLFLSAYIAVFTIRYLTMVKFAKCLAFLRGLDITQPGLDPFRLDIQQAIYWLNADRTKWMKWDPVNLAEGIFAMSNIVCFSRLSNLLTLNESLGPLQISLGRMLKDIMKFMVLFWLVIGVFMVSLQDVFWYYSQRSNIEIAYEGRQHVEGVKAEDAFEGIMASFRMVFWSLFGYGDPDAVQLGGYNNNVTEDIGYIIYGVYNIVMGTVLVNMLIAMMSRSFTDTVEDSDVEWKFSRSLIYMDYIKEGCELPPPFNILAAPKAVVCSLLSPYYDDDDVDVGNDNDDEDTIEDFVSAIANACSSVPILSVSGMDRPSVISSSGLITPRVPSTSDLAPPPQASTSGLTPPPVKSKSGLITPPALSASGLNSSPAVSVTGLSTSPAVSVSGEAAPEAMPEGGANYEKHAEVPVDGTDKRPTYQKTMKHILQRFIFDIHQEAEVTEDDLEEIKQDVGSLRHDLQNQWKAQEAAHSAVAEDVKRILRLVNRQLPTLQE